MKNCKIKHLHYKGKESQTNNFIIYLKRKKLEREEEIEPKVERNNNFKTIKKEKTKSIEKI